MNICGEELLAELAYTAYAIGLQHGLTVPPLKVELKLWADLREALEHRRVDDAVASLLARGLPTREQHSVHDELSDLIRILP
jgi:hypothetical protein